MRRKTMVLPAIVLVAFGLRAYAQPMPAPAPAPAPQQAATGDDAAQHGGFIGQDRPPLEIDDCPAKPPGDLDHLQRIAGEHFVRGEVLYSQGDYKGAVKELVSAYCIAPYYTILKDVGQAYERELDYELAIAYLEKYIAEVPRDAKRPDACSPDPQDDKQNVIARVQILHKLRAKILINTVPPDAKITLANDAGLAALGRSGKQLDVNGGTYQMTIEADGYYPIVRQIKAEIGKPYTYFERLDPRKGRLKIRVVPADARLFLDKRQVGTGTYDEPLEAGHYTLVAEAGDRLSLSRDVEVFPDRDTAVSFELPPRPQFGRRQLILYASFAGGAIGGTLAGAQSNPLTILGGVAGGIASGAFGTYYGTEHDIALGTSSLTITSSLIGGVVGGGLAASFTDNVHVISPLIGTGLLAGAGVGYYAGDRLRIRPGDAAVINSGAVWGTSAGVLLLGSFRAQRAVGAGIVLSGLGMGTIGGVLLTRYFTVSRARAALIDVGGVAGLFVGAAVESLVTQSTTSMAASDQQRERTANYTLGGLSAGLILAGVLTRHMDDPKLAVSPVITKTAAPSGGGSTTIFGVGGAF